VVEGEITAVLDFGAFIKFSLPDSSNAKTEKDKTLEGLIHISELDWQLIEDPSEIVKVGEEVKAQITKIFDNKVSLSMKALKKDPWEDFSKEKKVGDVITGKVSKFNDFGAFVQIDDKIQGLCHISEFGTQEKMKESLEINKEYKFEIISIEPKEHRLALKLSSE
jgi:small subunit ribosomal protein S1